MRRVNRRLCIKRRRCFNCCVRCCRGDIGDVVSVVGGVVEGMVGGWLLTLLDDRGVVAIVVVAGVCGVAVIDCLSVVS